MLLPFIVWMAVEAGLGEQSISYWDRWKGALHPVASWCYGELAQSEMAWAAWGT